jgi:hypothetical protein
MAERQAIFPYGISLRFLSYVDLASSAAEDYSKGVP